jgi:hypothetical protein
MRLMLSAAVAAGLLAKDVWTFDNQLPRGEGVPARIERGGETLDVTAWTPGGYEVHRVERLPATRVRPVLPAGYVRRFGTVEVSVTDDGSGLVAAVVPADVDVKRLGLTDAVGKVVRTGLLAPFEVEVDVAEARIVDQVVELPPGSFPILPGMAVRWDDRSGLVVATEPGIVVVRDAEARVEPELRLEDPDDVEVPLGAALAGLLAAAGAGFFVARRRAR